MRQNRSARLCVCDGTIGWTITHTCAIQIQIDNPWTPNPRPLTLDNYQNSFYGNSRVYFSKS